MNENHRLHLEFQAIKQARSSQKPVALPPEDNGVVVIFDPAGFEHNLSTPEKAQTFMAEYGKPREERSKPEPHKRVSQENIPNHVD